MMCFSKPHFKNTYLKINTYILNLKKCVVTYIMIIIPNTFINQLTFDLLIFKFQSL